MKHITNAPDRKPNLETVTPPATVNHDPTDPPVSGDALIPSTSIDGSKQNGIEAIASESTTPKAPDAIPASSDGPSVTSGDPITTAPPIGSPAPLSDGLVPIERLKPHPENLKIYGEKDGIDDLIRSIDLVGFEYPLKVTPDGIIISGHRRYRAAQKLGLKQVPVVVCHITEKIEIRKSLLESNRQRTKSNSQIAAEATYQVQIEHDLALQRKKPTAASGAVANLPPETKGKTRDIVGKKLGISGRTVEKAVKTFEVITDLRSKGKSQDADEVEKALNKGYDAGHKLAVKKGLIAKPKVKSKSNSKISTATKTEAAASPVTAASQPGDKLSGTSGQVPPAPRATPTGTNASGMSEQPKAASPPTKLDSDTALNLADRAITFLRACSKNDLTQQQRRDWGKVLDQIAGCRKALGF